MVSMEQLKIGDEVHYHPAHYSINEWENGLVKELRPPDGVWVVYNCAGEWHKFMDYTGCKTSLDDLHFGWREIMIPCDCRSMQEVDSLNEQGIARNQYKINVDSRGVLLDIDPHVRIKIPHGTFSAFAKWYLENQPEVK